MAKIKLGKTKDSRTRRQPKVEDADLKILQKQVNEKDQPSFINYLLQKGHSVSTINGYEVIVKRYLNWLKKEMINEDIASYNDVLHYIQSIRKTTGKRAIQKEVIAIKHYYNYLKELELVEENPTLNITVKGVKRRTLYNILSKQELEKLYNDFKGIERNSLVKKRNEIIVSLLIYQGLNTTELSRITTQDLKLREGKLFIKGTRKSNERTLKLEAHQILDFMEYTLQVRQAILAETGKQTDVLFTSLGASTKFHNLMYKLLPQLKKLNPKLESANQIRTSVITHWLKLYNLREVQYMAGHRYVSSTENYLINDLEGLQEDISKYHPIH